MSVFTEVTRAQLESFTLAFDLGHLYGFRGIAEGTENSNFFVSLEAGEYVLTLVERGVQADLLFTVTLLDRLKQAGLPVPFAIPNNQGQALLELAGRPALLQPRLAGKHVLQPNPQHCAEVGKALARMHLATHKQLLEHPPERGLPWMLAQGAALARQLSGVSLTLLNHALLEAQELQPLWARLPQANLHADLFRDNVLFDGTHLSGMIDFYNACSGPMLYDVAIAVSDWCSNCDGALDQRLLRAMLAGYAGLRPFTQIEELHWPAVMRVACLRFWLSRLLAARQPDQAGVQIKPPAEVEQRLLLLRNARLDLPMAL